jgi:hypothetical protein
MPTMTKKNMLIVGVAGFIILPVFAMLFSPPTQPLKAGRANTKFNPTPAVSTPEIRKVQVAVSADQLYADLVTAINANDTSKIKKYIETARREKFTTIVQMLDQSGWIKWADNEDKINQITPKPANISELCPPDQAAFIVTIMHYQEAYQKAEESGANSIQLG